MNVIKNLLSRILNFLHIKTITTEQQYTDNDFYQNSYEDIKRINFNAIFSSKLSSYACNQSTISLEATDKRSTLLADTVEQINEDKKKIFNRMFGSGGVLVIPYEYNGTILYNIIPQNRLSINKIEGEKIISATILADVKELTESYNKVTYCRFQNEEIRDGNLYITQIYTDGYGSIISKPDIYADIQDQYVVPNVDRCLFGYFKSPIDNRRSTNYYGVPITYGCGDIINEIYECLEQIRREYNIKQTFVGADTTLFGKDDKLPKNGLFRLVRGTGANGEDFWQIFDPAIRDSSYYTRLQELYQRLEKAIGTSKGILSEVQTQNATATEIKQSMYDTFTIVDDARMQFQKAMSDFIYACNILANFYNLTPEGTPKISYDWSYDLLENTQETFSQLTTGYNLGVVDKVELRQFIFPSEDPDEAKKKIDNISAENPSIDDLLGTNDR